MSDIDELIKDLYIDASQWALSGRTSCQIKYHKTVDALKSEIARLQSELDAERKKHMWIPVSERLPDDFGNFIIFSDCKEITVAKFDLGYKTWWAAGRGWNGFVTHWQPRPQPPEDDNDH
jgi:hypothetical protein